MKLLRPTRPFPAATQTRDGEPYEHMHPRMAATRLLREKIADRNAGIDKAEAAILVVDAGPHERVWVYRAIELCGLVIHQRPHGDGTRFRALLDADIREALETDLRNAPKIDDDDPDATGDDVSLFKALGDAKRAYDRRYPDGPYDQEAN